MRPGFNSVRLSAEQRHRVDCSLEATYELWTQIDPTQTGLILPEADVGVDNLADLGALSPDEQGALPIRAVIADKAKPRRRRAHVARRAADLDRRPFRAARRRHGSARRAGVMASISSSARRRRLAKGVKFDFLTAVDRPRAFVLAGDARSGARRSSSRASTRRRSTRR